jgi:hypothetical protein
VRPVTSAAALSLWAACAEPTGEGEFHSDPDTGDASDAPVAVDLGSVERVADLHAADDDAAVHAALATDVETGEVWLAVELQPAVLAAPDASELRTYTSGGGTWTWRDEASPLDRDKTRHYPSLVTWPQHGFVYLATKYLDATAPLAELQHRLLRQDRSALQTPPTPAFVYPPGPSPEDGVLMRRPTFAVDAPTGAEPRLYLCWTEVPDPGDPRNEDIRLVDVDPEGWPGSPWGSSSRSLALEPEEVQDHCTLAFTQDRSAVAAFHSGAGIAVRVEGAASAGSSARHPGGMLPAADEDGATDFPVVAAVPWGADERMIVVAEGELALVTWRCDGSADTCADPLAWSVSSWRPLDQGADQPQVVLDPVDGHAYALFERSSGNLGVARWCDGDAGWTLVGRVARPAEGLYDDLVFSTAIGSPTPVMALGIDRLGDRALHAAFVAREAADGSVDVFHWTLPLSDPHLCATAG